MLEVVAFIPLGHDGLHGERGLDHVRFTRSCWSSQKDHRSFCQESPKGKCIVKKETIAFMNWTVFATIKNAECSPRAFSN